MSLGGFLTAVQFLTRIPVTRAAAPSTREVRESLAYYPLVGLLLGLVLMLLATLSGPTSQTALSAALLLSLWVALTGGLHLDGLADCADAWVGGQGQRERTLALLRDPRCGAMAIIALVLVLLLKFAALQVLLARQAGALLLCAPLLGRTAIPLLFITTPYVRAGGLGAGLVPEDSLTLLHAVIGLAIGAVLLIGGWPGLIGTAAAALLWYGLRRSACHRLGGFTGDVAGAVLELTETAVLIVGAWAV